MAALRRAWDRLVVASHQMTKLPNRQIVNRKAAWLREVFASCPTKKAPAKMKSPVRAPTIETARAR